MELVVNVIAPLVAAALWLSLAWRTVRLARADPAPLDRNEARADPAPLDRNDALAVPAPLDRNDALAVVLAAVVARAVGAIAFARTPLFAWPLVDAQYYEEWARALAAGREAHAVFGVDPLYAHVLGGLYRVFGVSPWVPLALGAALGTATAALVHRLSARVASRPAALLIGVAAALHGPALGYDLLRLKSSLALCVTAALVEAFLAASGRWPGAALAPGALLGLASLNGAQALFAFPALALSAFRRRGGPARVALLAIPVGCALLWTLAHNARGGDMVPFHAGSGMILWASNNPAARGRLTALPYIRQDTRFEVADYRAEASRRLDRPVTASEASAYWRTLALSYLASDPAHAARLALVKLGYLLDAYEWPDNYDFRVLAQLVPHLALPLPGWGWVMPLALLGLALAFTAPQPGSRVIGACAVLLALPLVITYSNGRLRLPLLACGWPLAAMAIDGCARARWPRILALVIIAAAIHTPVEQAPIAAGLVGVAEACRQDGLYDQAMELYAWALRSDPDHFGALNNLGALALAGGRLDAAVRLFQRAVTVRPESRPAWFSLGHAWRRSGRPHEALDAYARARGGADLPEALIDLKVGLALADDRRDAQARAMLERALAELARHPSGSAEELDEARQRLRQLAP